MELQRIMEDNDFSKVMYVDENLGLSLTRVEIEGVLIGNGHELPLANNVTFRIHDKRNHFFIVTYDRGTDKYLYNRVKVV